MHAMEERRSNRGAGGIGMGVILAMILSYTTNGSILLCILHGVLSWLYVLYWVLVVGC
jgi:hypothetical protein